MNPLTQGELWDLTRYELERETYRASIIRLKRPRYVPVGPQVTFVFENRDTVRFQVQEMMRAERLVKPEAIQAELDVYNELLPGKDELSATMMIEITDSGAIRPVLDQLIGIDEHVFLEIGEARLQARFDAKQLEEDRISAVQYVRFELGPELAADFRRPEVPVTLRVEHPRYAHARVIEGASRESLIGDLA